MNYLIDMVIGLQFIFRPSFWISNSGVNLTYDAWLQKELDKPDPVSCVGQYTCVVGGKVIWVGNFPYSYGHLYSPEIEALPRRATRIKLQNKLIEHSLKTEIE